MQRITRSGRYYRVCDPTWADPSDTTYSHKRGGRWNPPGEFGALYLCATIGVAKANARRHIASLFGNAVSLFDLQPAHQPDLQHYELAPAPYADIVSPAGIADVGLPAAFPAGVLHGQCWDVGRNAYALFDLNGIAALSAVLPTEEELAVFDRSVAKLAAKQGRQTFVTWFI